MNSRFISTYETQTRNPTRSQTYTTNFYNTFITTTVTSTPAVAREWVYNLRRNHGHSLSNCSLVIGLGVQWQATKRPHTAATLQLNVDNDCLIFQLSHATNIPATLHRLLEDERVTIVGVHNHRDKTLLQESWAQLEVWELVDLAREQGFGNKSMGDICGDVLGLHGIVKPRVLGLSDWDAFWLSADQVQYACVDAHIAYLLGVEFGNPKDDYSDYDYRYHGDEYDGDNDGGRYYCDNDGVNVKPGYPKDDYSDSDYGTDSESEEWW